VRRDWLVQQGARPVIYGDNRVWSRLDQNLRPFFQLRSSRGRGGMRRFDWTAEREWRHVGDVLLDAIPPDAALLFVPQEAEAQALSLRSPWPILLLPHDDE
jgi:hypothetical protein